MSLHHGRTQDIAPAEFRVANNKAVNFVLKRLLGSRSGVATKARSLIWREEHLSSGTVSIVVPFFNVDKYLGATLESIRLQRYRDLQVVLVDDGSTDGSRTIATEFVAMDDRFELLSSPNVGPGGARNRGLEQASGRFISFVDGDDVLPYGAIYRQVQALQESSVDFCVGAFERLDGSRRWRLPWVTNQHSDYRPAVTLTEVPGITRNVFPWNKLFTRTFFDTHIGGFPEGTIYEDQVPSALAYTAGESFTVLAETVYHWRTRDSKDSITQNRSSLEHLETRIAVLREVDAIYSKSAENVYREWLLKTVNEDLIPFVEASRNSTEAYRSLLSSLAREVWAQLTPAEQLAAQQNSNANIVKALREGDFESAWTSLGRSG